MSTRKLVAVASLAVVAAAVLGWLILPSDRGAPQPPPPVVERTRDQLELRDGRLFETGAGEPFAGLLVGSYPSGQRKIAIEIHDGKPHGRSRGWHDNGQLEVDEQFVDGVADGPRTRWYENGQMRSSAQIEGGVITGTFTRWHDNGHKAAEATMVDGKPDGVSRGWHPSGAPKSMVELRGGQIVSREYWHDSPD